MNASTRKQVIKAWEGSDKYLNFYVCPDCRDILVKYGAELHCGNAMCGNDDSYTLSTGEEI